MEIGDAVGGVDEDFKELLRGVVGDGLDVHAAFGGGDDDGARGGAVQKDGQIVFFLNVARDGEVDRLDLAADGAGLGGDEGLAKHVAGHGEGIGFGFAEFDAAFEAVGERAFAAATGVDLGFHHGRALGEGGEGGDEGLGVGGGGAFGHSDAEFLKEGFGLILVDVHAGKVGG